MRALNSTFFIVMCFFSTALGQQRGMKTVEMRDEKGQEFVAYDNSYALVIGINRFSDPKIPSLNYAVQDAQAIAELLSQLEFPKENIKLLTNEDATLLRVKEEFVALGAKTKKNDRLLVYWAGHGETESLPRGGEMGYLIPTDGKADHLFETCLSMDELKRLSERVSAKHVLFLVDACYGGLSAVASRSLPKETELYLQKVTSAEATEIITAGTKDEEVVESPTWGHSAFAKAILDGFNSKVVDRNGDGVVTADELFSYLQPKVFELSRSEDPHGHRPVMAKLKASEGEFTFVVSVPEYSLLIDGLPQTNTVYVNGDTVAQNKDTVRKSFRRGTYTVEIEAPGHDRFSTTVDLTADRELNPHMTALTVPYMLETNPGGASVKMDGTDMGQTPLRKEIMIGQHRFEISKAGYEPLGFVSNVTNQNIYEKKELKPQMYDISVISNPRGAQILLNELPQGSAPATLQVRPGLKYTLEIQNEGQKLSTTFEPAGSGAVSADFGTNQIQYAGPVVQTSKASESATRGNEEKPPAQASPTKTFLEIVVEPEDAAIVVDGSAVIPAAGLARVEVEPGKRIILASKSGYESGQFVVDVNPGETRRVPVKLNEESSSRWWLYAGGAVLVGGAAYLLLAKGKEEPTVVADPYGSPPVFPPIP